MERARNAPLEPRLLQQELHPGPDFEPPQQAKKNFHQPKRIAPMLTATGAKIGLGTTERTKMAKAPRRLANSIILGTFSLRRKRDMREE